MSVSVVDKGNLNQDQEDVLERFIEFQYAMIDKDDIFMSISTKSTNLL